MESAVVAVVAGAVMIMLGLTRGLWQAFVDGVIVGIANFSAALRGFPAHAHPRLDATQQREPLVALIGVALVLLGILSQLAA